MKLSKQIKPISFFKSHAAEIIRTLHESGEPYVITQNGEAKAVIQDIESYEKDQETMALLKILALDWEIFFKPYRIMYITRGKQVTVMLIADGRRDMRSLLERRLLNG